MHSSADINLHRLSLGNKKPWLAITAVLNLIFLFLFI